MTGRDVLDDQYAGTGRLTARQSLWQLRTGPALHTVVLDRARLDGAETVVDIGCGNGTYLAELRRRGHTGTVVGLDRSAGMARHARQWAATTVADVQALPFGDDTADVVLCLHMLYHVPDLHTAVAELRRVLRPGGTAMITTNGPRHAVEAKELLAAAARQVSGPVVDPTWDIRRFDPSIARAVLGAAFDEVDVHETGDTMRVRDPAAIVDYVSSWPPESVGLSDGPAWRRILDAVAALVTDHFTRHPTFAVSSQVAVFRCR